MDGEFQSTKVIGVLDDRSNKVIGVLDDRCFRIVTKIIKYVNIPSFIRMVTPPLERHNQKDLVSP